MEMKQINESTLKISVSLDDLDTYGMELKDFFMPQEKTEEFFYTILDELDIPDTFKSTGMLSFRVTPRQDRVDVFVTKSELNEELDFEQMAEELSDYNDMDPEDFFKNLEQSLMAKGDTEAHEQLKNIEALLDDAIESLPKTDTSERSSNQASQPKDSDEKEDTQTPEAQYVHYAVEFPSLEAAIVAAQALDVPIEASELFKSNDGYYMTALFYIANESPLRANQLKARLYEYGKPSSYTRPYLLEHTVRLLDGDAVDRLKRIELVPSK